MRPRWRSSWTSRRMFVSCSAMPRSAAWARASPPPPAPRRRLLHRQAGVHDVVALTGEGVCGIDGATPFGREEHEAVVEVLRLPPGESLAVPVGGAQLVAHGVPFTRTGSGRSPRSTRDAFPAPGSPARRAR